MHGGDRSRPRQRERHARHIARSWLGVALFAVVGVPTAAEQWRLVLDPATTEVRIELGATLHTVRGAFQLRAGELRFDPDGGPVEGSVVVDAASGDTGNTTRDANMHDDVLASAEHPDLVLHPERLRVIERNPDGLRGVLDGRIEIRGAPHPVEIPLQATRLEPGRVQVTGRFDVPYVEWGLPDLSTFVLRVDKTLSVQFVAEGALELPLPLGTPHPEANQRGQDD